MQIFVRKHIFSAFAAIFFSYLPSASFSQEIQTQDQSSSITIISSIQTKLVEAGCYSQEVTGTLTPQTLSAIERFVDAAQYDSTKPLNAVTLLELLDSHEIAGCLDKSAITKLVQTELNRLGCALGQADGIVGRRSVAALRAFIESSNIDTQYDPSLFSQISFLNKLRGLSSPVCLTVPLPEPYNLAGVWRANFNCPDRSTFEGEAEIYGVSGNTYRVRYYDDGGVGAGVLTLSGQRVTGTINYQGQRTSFNLMLGAGGTSLRGTTDRACMFSARRISR